VKRTKDENLLAGSTGEAPDGIVSLPVMKDGEEPPDMLLALLNNALASLANSQQVKILGTALGRGGVGTLVMFYGFAPETANSLKPIKAVGNA